MKVVIFAGGLGTRLSEETNICPKPMVEIGGKPILWHIMKIYAYYGFTDFVILSGYLSHYIKDYFVNYYNRYSDITVDMSNNTVEIHKTRHEPWKVTILYTGENTMTGARLKKAQNYIGDERFLLTYGDGVADIDILASIKSHEESKKVATMSVVSPIGRFGSVILKDGAVSSFTEKPQNSHTWINAGFFVCEPKVFDYIKENDESISFEHQPLQNLSKDNELNAYKHTGFWQPMDTMKDKKDLTNLWTSTQAPWAIWNKKKWFFWSDDA